MQIQYSFLSPPGRCGYLPEQTWSLRYEVVRALDAGEFGGLLQLGWRRFGTALFRPECAACRRCQSIRVPVATFKPDRSQKRAWKSNTGIVTLTIGTPSVSAAKLKLHDAFHEFQSDTKGWPGHGPKDAAGYEDSFVNNPFPTEEWCYWLGEKLIGVGYVDPVPVGLSAIYFFYDPDERGRSLGTFNVLNVMAEAAKRGLPHVYLGYYVAGCASLEYKARFQPNEVRDPDTGDWVAFRQPNEPASKP